MQLSRWRPKLGFAVLEKAGEFFTVERVQILAAVDARRRPGFRIY
jgi:hypothetical protein